jgi:peptidoglycan/LPS O-acetylase OafA/YrhL
MRIFAAGAVFLSHLGPPDTLPAPLRTFMSAGYNGVTLFFVLSGFVLAWNYFDRVSTRQEVWSFAVARFARIYPLYLVAMVVAAVLQSARPGAWWLWHIFALQTWSSTLAVAYGLNGPGWSIGVEFFMYATFPLLVLLIRRVRRGAALIAVGVGVCVALGGATAALVIHGNADLPWGDPMSAHRWLYRTPVTRLGDFLVGIVCALLVRRTGASPRLGLVAQWVGVVGCLLAMASPAMLFTAWSWDVAYLVPAALMIWGLATNPDTPLARLLAVRPIVFAGEVSFAFYLFHQPILIWLGLASGGLLSFTLGATATFVVVFLVATAAHLLVERPAQQWIRRVLSPRPTTAGDIPSRAR